MAHYQLRIRAHFVYPASLLVCDVPPGTSLVRDVATTKLVADCMTKISLLQCLLQDHLKSHHALPSSHTNKTLTHTRETNKQKHVPSSCNNPRQTSKHIESSFPLYNLSFLMHQSQPIISRYPPIPPPPHTTHTQNIVLK